MKAVARKILQCFIFLPLFNCCSCILQTPSTLRLVRRLDFNLDLDQQRMYMLLKIVLLRLPCANEKDFSRDLYPLYRTHHPQPHALVIKFHRATNVGFFVKLTKTIKAERTRSFLICVARTKVLLLFGCFSKVRIEVVRPVWPEFR